MPDEYDERDLTLPALPTPDDPANIPPDRGDAGPAGGEPTSEEVPG